MSDYPPNQGNPEHNQGSQAPFPGGFNFGGQPPQEQQRGMGGSSTQAHGGPYSPPPTQGSPNGAQNTSYGLPPPQQGGSHCPPNGAQSNSNQLPPGVAVCPPHPNGNPKPPYDWIYASGGAIPPNAVQGGVESDGKPLFIARQFYQGGLHVGKAAPHLKSISIGYGGKEINLKDYYVLCGDARQLRWVECHGVCKPDNWRPIEAGHESDGKPLFVSKTRYDGGEHVGKAGTHLNGGMSFGFGGKEKTTKDSYFVLAYL
ncbi:hypothetical protein K7432_000463 [Basidiobolus ranarum]|uniref:Uncharacterized protein n=1 Tax=Basidiobolus ranarum TaxID=34480 RepID=A0ABR2X4Q5_9FUNG